jgi:hypothetical protein
MRYTLNAPGALSGDVTQIGWNSGKKRKIIVNVPAAGGAQPATPVAYFGHTRMDLLTGAQNVPGGIPITPANSPYIFHDWAGDCFVVGSSTGVIADISSEEERAPEWEQTR